MSLNRGFLSRNERLRMEQELLRLSQVNQEAMGRSWSSPPVAAMPARGPSGDQLGWMPFTGHPLSDASYSLDSAAAAHQHPGAASGARNGLSSTALGTMGGRMTDGSSMAAASPQHIVALHLERLRVEQMLQEHRRIYGLPEGSTEPSQVESSLILQKNARLREMAKQQDHLKAQLSQKRRERAILGRDEQLLIIQNALLAQKASQVLSGTNHFQKKAAQKASQVLSGTNHFQKKAPTTAPKAPKAATVGVRLSSFSPIRKRSTGKQQKLYQNPPKKTETKWMAFFQELKAYKLEFGDCAVPRVYSKNPRFANWVSDTLGQ